MATAPKLDAIALLTHPAEAGLEVDLDRFAAQ